MDNLRALAMLLGLFLHAAFAYASPSQTFWLATDQSSSVAIDASIWFIHLFRMSLFFVIAGYLSKLTIAKKGTRKFLWNRVIRIVLPFSIFYPAILITFTLVIGFAMRYTKEPRGLMGFIVAASQSEAYDSAKTQFSTMHLWFLYYLFFFTLAGAFLSHFPRLSFVRYLKSRFLIVLAPLVLLPAILAAGVPLPAPESFVPTWWPFGFYGVFYFAGWQLHGRENRLESLAPMRWYFALSSLIGFAVYYYCMPAVELASILTGQYPTGGLKYTLTCVLTAYLSVTLTISALLLGREFLSTRNAFLRLFSDASYWIYLIHLPIVLFLQTLLLPVQCSLWIKLAIVLATTSLLCMASYLVFVRYTPIGTMLNGKRSFP